MQKNLSMVYSVMFLIPFMGLFCFDNLLFVWILMEMQMMCYVCTLALKGYKSSYMLFFIVIQLMVGVLLFYFCFLVNIKEMQEQNVMTYLMLLTLFIKMGMYPFASWALKFISYLHGMDYLLFLTVMKIVPLAMCFYVEDSISLVLILANWIYSCIILSYYSSYKKIVFFSSISNTCVFLSFFFMGFLSMAKMFLLFYFFYLFFLLIFLEKSGCDFIFSGKTPSVSIILLLMIFSLVGLPFLWGFAVKIMFISTFFFSNSLLFFIFLFFVSLIFSFFYMKLIFFSFTSNNFWFANTNFNFFFESSFFVYFSIMVLPLIVLSMFVLGSSFFI